VDRIDHFPKIISHRGVCRRQIENTIPAFKAAKDAKVDMIEMDVHETGDGRFIVVHDGRLDPDTPPWRNLTYPQVRAVTGVCLSGPWMTRRIWRNLSPGKWTASFQIVPIACKHSNIGGHFGKPDEFFMKIGAGERNHGR